ncbi:MAG: hypothetical protein ACJAT7_000776 [Psychromonas sp.]|jgi:hypothetical protein
MKRLIKQWGWMIILWGGSVLALTIFAYLLRFVIK